MSRSGKIRSASWQAAVRSLKAVQSSRRFRTSSFSSSRRLRSSRHCCQTPIAVCQVRIRKR
uniref:Uncharacterized 6.9 kDa protein in 100 kDa protein region n=1 Tax=Human adenovirus F serotype 41 TaxID=10524 RepID=YL13_ADE41|nr:RecName: Full=Uncharacterized 6.9 kDa protein in 100 kDa protein region [Human adenovirus 41]CAA36763.1 unnamed protein product [Human adenovirus 41]